MTYKIDSEHLLNSAGKIVGIDWTLEATDSDMKALWKVVYYHQEFILNLETDVQESYPVDFKIDDEVIIIEHEYGIIFQVSFKGILKEEKKSERSCDFPPPGIE